MVPALRTAIWAVLVSLSGAPAMAAADSGIVIEEARPGLMAAKAGLQPGDVVRRWTRGDAQGTLESPFELAWLEVEQAPRGPVTLEGFRGDETRTWTLAEGVWAVRARPALPEPPRLAYEAGLEQATAGHPAEAAGRWREAATRLGPDRSPWMAAWLLFRAAQVLATDVRQWTDASTAFDNALEHARDAGPVVRTQVLRLSSDAAFLASDLEGAERRGRQMLEEAKAFGDESLTLARANGILGNVSQFRRDDPDRADEYLRRALALQEKIAPGSLAVATTLQGLGNVAMNRSDLAAAAEYHGRSLAIRERLAPGSREEAISVGSLASVAIQRYDLAKAEEGYRRALVLFQRLNPDSMEVARTYNGLANIAEYRDDRRAAEEDYRRALAIAEKVQPDGLDIAGYCINLGNLAHHAGDGAKAEQYYARALAIQEKLAPNGLDAAVTLGNLAIVFKDRGELAKAEDYDRRAAAITEAVAPRSRVASDVLMALGDIVRERGDLPQAEQIYRRALAIREVVCPDSMAHAETLAALSALLRRTQRLEAAEPLIEQAVVALEQQAARLGGAGEVRAGFRAAHLEYYTDYIDLLLERKQPERAFEVLERSRAQTLLEMLAEARVDVRGGIDPQLLERARSLQGALGAASERRLRLLGRAHAEAQLAENDKKIADLMAQVQQIEGEIRSAAPAYASLVQPQPMALAEIQRLLDPETLLLEYKLGASGSSVWAVSSEAVLYSELPKQADIDGLALRFRRALTARGTAVRGESAVARRARLRRAEEDLPVAAAALAQAVLGPVARQLGARRLVIVADGVLQYVPFSALPVPGATASPLILEHEVVHLPSASVLALLRREAAGRKAPLKAVAVLADPVFDAADARVHTPGAASPSAAPPPPERLTRSAEDVGLTSGQTLRLPRLAHSRDEAQAIVAVVPPGQVRSALDFEASRAAAMSPQLADYRIVHFATHGLLNSEHPELSGLVFSLVDQKGAAQDGFLELQDVYNMSLPVDMVVLSACASGLGKEIDGEGIIGLTRGFMYAGATRVVASLWNVDDLATAELMRRFYDAMQQQGLPPSAALRQAQTGMWRTGRWRAPYYWAAFQLQGEWR
jgi:CHAT domain-containing protein/Tfp pilus assembly protein PilF